MVKPNMSTLGFQLREHRERRNISQRALSDATGIEQATISRIERGEQELVSPHLATLAKFLGIDVLNPLGSNVEPIMLDGGLVPVWSQADVARIARLPNAEQQRETKQHIMSAKKHSSDTFAMTLTDDSMLPRFRRGDIVIVDPKLRPEVGTFVVAASENEPSGIFGQYASRGKDRGGNPLFELMPLNTLYASRRSDEDVLTILGVAVEKIETQL
jgi:SOS-response transcriptional repressor LexA